MVELEFAEGYGINDRDRSFLDVLRFSGVPDLNGGGYFMGRRRKVREQIQPMEGDLAVEILSGTEIFFVNCNIIEQQNIVSAKAPLIRVIDTGRKLTDGKLHFTSSTIQEILTELQFKKLISNSGKEVYVELVTHTGTYIPFVGTGRVVLTLMFRKIWNNAKLLFMSSYHALFHRACSLMR